MKPTYFLKGIKKKFYKIRTSNGINIGYHIYFKTKHDEDTICISLKYSDFQWWYVYLNNNKNYLNFSQEDKKRGYIGLIDIPMPEDMASVQEFKEKFKNFYNSLNEE